MAFSAAATAGSRCHGWSRARNRRTAYLAVGQSRGELQFRRFSSAVPATGLAPAFTRFHSLSRTCRSGWWWRRRHSGAPCRASPGILTIAGRIQEVETAKGADALDRRAAARPERSAGVTSKKTTSRTEPEHCQCVAAAARAKPPPPPGGSRAGASPRPSDDAAVDQAGLQLFRAGLGNDLHRIDMFSRL